ncbi:helix-hairpin-helix domain-containing protein [Enterobacter hormaechei]
MGKKIRYCCEDCVNGVGVDLNTPLCTAIDASGRSLQSIAQNIIAWRDENGRFVDRKQLLKVARLGPKAFEAVRDFYVLVMVKIHLILNGSP